MPLKHLAKFNVEYRTRKTLAYLTMGIEEGEETEDEKRRKGGNNVIKPMPQLAVSIMSREPDWWTPCCWRYCYRWHHCGMARLCGNKGSSWVPQNVISYRFSSFF